MARALLQHIEAQVAQDESVIRTLAVGADEVLVQVDTAANATLSVTCSQDPDDAGALWDVIPWQDASPNSIVLSGGITGVRIAAANAAVDYVIRSQTVL